MGFTWRSRGAAARWDEHEPRGGAVQETAERSGETITSVRIRVLGRIKYRPIPVPRTGQRPAQAWSVLGPIAHSGGSAQNTLKRAFGAGTIEPA